MTADRLREAARVLRAYVDKLTTDTDRWDEAFPSGRGLYADTSTYERLIMHPGVGLALADWLDTAGADLWAHGPLCECGSGCHRCDSSLWQPHARRALALADLILGGAVDG